MGKKIKNMKRVKQLISSVEIGPDFYTITWRDKSKASGEIERGGVSRIYFDDHDNMIKILLKLDKIYQGELIPAKDIADELTVIHPELKTKMLRPTGKYSKFYYASLHLEFYFKRVEYLYRGAIYLNDLFFKKHSNGVPKRGLNRYLDS